MSDARVRVLARERGRRAWANRRGASGLIAFYQKNPVDGIHFVRKEASPRIWWVVYDSIRPVVIIPKFYHSLCFCEPII